MNPGDFLDPLRVWWILVGFAIPAIMGLAFGKLQEQAKASTREKADLIKRMDSLEAGQRCLLKDRIVQACTFWQGQGYCPYHARETIIDMFESYQSHGGNSFVHDEIQACLDLPHERKELRQ